MANKPKAKAAAPETFAVDVQTEENIERLTGVSEYGLTEAGALLFTGPELLVMYAPGVWHSFRRVAEPPVPDPNKQTIVQT